MRMRKSDLPLPDPAEVKRVCIECGKPLYDGRKKVCDACKAAKKKASSKRPAIIERYAKREELLAAVAELEDAVKMQEWILQQSKIRLNTLKAIAFEIK